MHYHSRSLLLPSVVLMVITLVALGLSYAATGYAAERKAKIQEKQQLYKFYRSIP